MVKCSSPDKKDNTDKEKGIIIVGSVCGGIVLIAAVVYVLVRYVKYRKWKRHVELTESFVIKI